MKWSNDNIYIGNYTVQFTNFLFACWLDQVKSSHLYLYSAFNNTNCNKALHNITIGKFCQCKMTGFNTQLSAECISLLNLVMALSSLIISVQSSRWLCCKWSVPNWASQRRQRQGTKTPSVTEWRKNLGRNQAQSGGQFPSGQTNQ